MMLSEHRVKGTSHTHFYSAFFREFNNRKMLFNASFHCISFQFFHLLSTADKRNIGIDKLHNHVAAMTAFVKFKFHKFKIMSQYY